MSITAKQLSRMQAHVANVSCTLPCSIQRRSVTKDQYGSESETWSVVETTICGMSEPSGGQLQNYDFLIGSLAAWQLRLPYGTNIQHYDHVLVTGAYTEQTLEVQVILEPRSYATLVTALASEVK